MKKLWHVIFCLWFLIWGAFIIYFYGSTQAYLQESSMKIVGFDCSELIYENSQGQTFKRGPDDQYVRAGK